MNILKNRINILKNLFLFDKNSENTKGFSNEILDHYIEIANLVKEARIQQNLSIKELSRLSKIPEQIINSIENNNKNMRPKYPFIRSILIKLEECLVIKNNTFKVEKKDFLVSKFDLINTWQGILLYFLLLVLCIFILKRYFVLNVNVIQIQNIENKIIDK